MAKSVRKHEYYHHTAVPFDPLKYVKELENVGFTREQAEVQAETFFSIVQEQLVSKYDLKELENELKQSSQMMENELKQTIKEFDAKTTLELAAIRHDTKEIESSLKQSMKELENELKQNMKALENELKHDMKALENGLKQSIKELDAKTINQSELLRRDLKLWFGGMLVTLILAFSTLVTLIPHLTGH